MDIGTGFTIFLVLLALVVVTLVWYWWTQPTFFAPLPCYRFSRLRSLPSTSDAVALERTPRRRTTFRA